MAAANSGSTNSIDTSVVEHPLQDVDITTTYAIDTPVANTQNGKTINKENWVKFDDDVNAKDSVSNNTNTVSNLNNPNNYKQAINSNVNDSSARNDNNSKTNTTTNSSPSGVDITAIKPATLVPPAQSLPKANSRTRDAAANMNPAVLSTESIHVNLTTTGQIQQNTGQHKYENPKQNRPAISSGNISNNSGIQQLQHQQSQQHYQHQLPHHTISGSSNSSTAKNTNNNNKATNKAATTAPSATSVTIPSELQPAMRTIELSTGHIREGFANGDIIVTLLPANTKWAWITPAIFRPELVPEELMAQGLTLTVEEYVNAMETLVNDYRFNIYNICYKRILVCWILFAFTVLLSLLFSGLQGVALFSLGVAWLFLNAAAIFICMWIKFRLARGLEKCLARVNRQLIKHKILLVLDDRGHISCHKINLCFMYFDSTPCVNYLNDFLEQTEQNGGDSIKAGWETKLDLDLNDIIVQGSNSVRVSRKQAVAQELYLSYLQRWGKHFLRRRLDWTVQEAGVHETPRHLQSAICPCQYEEEILRNKIKIQMQRKCWCNTNCLPC